jgi:hypothetical protein
LQVAEAALIGNKLISEELGLLVNQYDYY